MSIVNEIQCQTLMLLNELNPGRAICRMLERKIVL
jgi:hypothetical protein